jgi:serine/threonine-protein kinase
MGEVFRARDSRLGREVAIKVLPERYAQDPDRLTRFEREARAVATLAHPNILVLYDVGTDHGVAYAVMELLEGETLRSEISRSAFSWRKVLEIGSAIAEGLAAAHAKGIVHRDLKPENIFLTAEGRVKILDFGLARMEKSSSPLVETGPYQPGETEPGIVMGTVGYMAPEQVKGGPVDARTDLFALGCVLYEMLAARRAFPGRSAPEIQAAILRDDPLPLAELGKEVPPSLDRLIRHCLEKKPPNRFQSARDLVFDLRALSTDSGMVRGSFPSGKSRPLLTVGIITALVILGIVSAFFYSRHNFDSPVGQPSAVYDSVAVLPFENASTDPEIEYLCDGIIENVINSLTQLPKLRVIARTTAFTYKGRKVDPQKVGQELKVRAVLTGKIMQRGKSPVIQVDLVDADGFQLWGEKYPKSPGVPRVQKEIRGPPTAVRKVSGDELDILSMQEDILSQVVEKLPVQMTDVEKQRLTRRSTDKDEAYRLYLRGMYHINKYTLDDLNKAQEDFDRALAIDPRFALAYVGKANAFYGFSNIYLAPREVMPKARVAAVEALRIDDTLGEGHAILGVVKALYDWDWPAAEVEFARALELNPGSSNVRVYYGVCLAMTGRFDEAVQQVKKAQELDPLSSYTLAYSIHPLFFARQHSEAIRQLQSAINLDPKCSLFHAYLGLNYEQTGDFPKAIAAMRQNLNIEDTLEGKAQLAHALALEGKSAEAQRLLADLMKESKTRYVSPINIAMIHLGLWEKEKDREKEKDQAFEWLQKAAEDHSEWFSFLNVDPRLDSIRLDPRFDALKRRIQLVAPK